MKIRVAFFGEILIKNFDGASRTMFQIIDRIPKEDYDFTFFCGVPPEGDFPHEVVKVPAMKIPFNSTYRMAIPIFHTRNVWKKLKAFAPDVIHIASPSPLGNLALVFAKKYNIPVIGIYHTHFISYVDYYLRKVPFALPVVKPHVVKGQRKFYDKMNRLLVPTEQMVVELGEYGFDTNNMKIWKRGLDHSIFNPAKKNITKLQELTGNSRKNIIFASRLVWEKNLQTLIDIYDLMQKENKNYNLIIAGDGVARPELEDKMPNAFFLGTISHTQLAEVYASSDVFVFPSVTETYGNVVVEAMASGCPAVIAAGGGSQSHVQHGQSGFLASPNNAAEYLQHIGKICTDESLAESLTKHGLEYTKELNWDILCANYFDQVQDLIHEYHNVKQTA